MSFLLEVISHPQIFPALAMVIYSLLGVLLAVLGYKIFDRLTPGDLHREIIENRNVAAAILCGTMILGVCIIVAAAMLG
jgi:uncharacterized membrane protein YjfL (UPF0719 family)